MGNWGGGGYGVWRGRGEVVDQHVFTPHLPALKTSLPEIFKHKLDEPKAGLSDDIR